MFQDSPIYDRLVAERGDVPAGVRREADRVRRELEVAMMPLQSYGHSSAPHSPPPQARPDWQQQRRPELP
ncbi:hypothetical protein [Streptomyces sp. V3I7]|uniref:hypothetical protein n=1 Tax=Streptomyces sp. V3I7 TaxID=3042278 RepID=UPI0027D912CD|nr:hypothetical protein [Streptomyces sp. V3I7]